MKGLHGYQEYSSQHEYNSHSTQPQHATLNCSPTQTGRYYSQHETSYLDVAGSNTKLGSNLSVYTIKPELNQEHAYPHLPQHGFVNSGFNLEYINEFENYKAFDDHGNTRSTPKLSKSNYVEITNEKLTSFDTWNCVEMSGGPPHSHGRQVPSPSTVWNHLQVPNYYPRQPQHAHMSNEHPIVHQPTWHTPTTEPIKSASHSHIYNLEQAIPERPYTRHSPGIDLTLQRNGNQNGELSSTPISLSVRDTNKINSLPPSATQAVELTKSLNLKSSGLVVKPVSSLCRLPNSNSVLSMPNPSTIDKLDSPKNLKRLPKSMDSVIERLNPTPDNKLVETTVIVTERSRIEKVEPKDKPVQNSVIVQPLSAISNVNDESSNSSSIANVPTPTNVIDDDVVSPFSNEDSTDSNKSRRKRKPFKTMRLSKDTELPLEQNCIQANNNHTNSLEASTLEQRRSESAPPGNLATAPIRTRRKTSSESESIANIAAMVQHTISSKHNFESNCVLDNNLTPASAIKSKEAVLDMLCTPLPKVPTLAQKKLTEPTKSFVEVENQLEEMFAGISDDTSKPVENKKIQESKKSELDETRTSDDNLLKLDDNNESSYLQESITSTSSDLNSSRSSQKRIRKKPLRKRYSTESMSEESSPKRSKGCKKSKLLEDSPEKANTKKTKSKSQNLLKSENIKDVNASDSGSNTSSIKSKGPFIHITGLRESPLAVQVINSFINDDDVEKKISKPKKYHDDGEYRHKVRSRGLHSSTLSNKYDAQTRDATWICVFCKLGPHAASNSDFKGISPGDLFGPYLITCNSAEYTRHLDDSYDKEFKSKKVVRALNAAGAINKTIIKRSKRKHSDSIDSHSSVDKSESDVYMGMTETGDNTYEVWAHEDCMVWSQGVYLVGPKIVGLEEAVWSACNVVCSKCHCKGANLCCVRRGCLSVMHYGCAAVSDWFLDTDNYKVLCLMHKSS